MDWAFLLQDNKNQKIILRLPGTTVNAKPGEAWRIPNASPGQQAVCPKKSLKSCEGQWRKHSLERLSLHFDIFGFKSGSALRSGTKKTFGAVRDPAGASHKLLNRLQAWVA